MNDSSLFTTRKGQLHLAHDDNETLVHCLHTSQHDALIRRIKRDRRLGDIKLLRRIVDNLEIDRTGIGGIGRLGVGVVF